MINKILAIGDIQFHNFKPHSKIVDGMNTRLRDCINVWDQAQVIGLQQDCDVFALTGDIFEAKGKLDVSVNNETIRCINQTSLVFEHFYMVAGNHDYDNHNGKYTSLDICRLLSHNIHLATHSLKYDQSTGIMMMPYYADTNEFKGNFSHYTNKYKQDLKAVIIHQGIDNFATTKDVPPVGLASEWLKAQTSAWVLAGHYHIPGRDENIINVGSPLMHKFLTGNETALHPEERGCWVIDVEGDNAEFYPLTAPKLITFDLDTIDKSQCEGNFIRLRTNNSRKAESLKKQAIEAGSKSVVIKLEKTFTTAHEESVTLSPDIRNMLGQCIDIMKVKQDKTKLLQLFDKICT